LFNGAYVISVFFDKWGSLENQEAYFTCVKLVLKILPGLLG
jgi:hypothetical protein